MSGQNFLHVHCVHGYIVFCRAACENVYYNGQFNVPSMLYCAYWCITSVACQYPVQKGGAPCSEAASAGSSSKYITIVSGCVKAGGCRVVRWGRPRSILWPWKLSTVLLCFTFLTVNLYRYTLRLCSIKESVCVCLLECRQKRINNVYIWKPCKLLNLLCCVSYGESLSTNNFCRWISVL